MTLAAYWPATQCGYIWDDDDHIENNQTLRSAQGLSQVWFRIGATPQYYPLVHTSYWLEYRLWGLDPTGYHVVNILLHAAGSVLLWRVLWLLDLPGAWLAAALFALHPVQAESVAWITQRKNVLSGVFYFGAGLAYLRWALGSGPGRRPWLYAAALVLFLGALLAKTVTCSLPAALLIVLWWKRGRLGWLDLRALIPFLSLGVLFGLLTVVMETHVVGAAGKDWDLSWLDRCLIAGRAIWFYAGKLFWPSPLIFVYPRWEIDAAATAQYLFPAAAVAVVVGLWLARGHIRRGPLAAVLFFIGTLVPALGFFNVYPMRYSFVADHFQYLACLGVIVPVAAAGWRAAAQFRPWSGGVVVLILATLGTLTWCQEHNYMDRETLWRHTIEKNPGAWMAHNNLGLELQSHGKLDEAITCYLEALRINPDSPTAYNNLANALQTQGRLDEAISHYLQALQLAPRYGDAHYNLANALQSQGQLDDSVRHYRQALEVKPKFAPAHHNLAKVLAAQGRLDEAIERYRRALRIRSEYPIAQKALEDTLTRRHRLDEAVRTIQDHINARPDDAEAHYNLALALMRRRRLDEALEQFRSAAHLAPQAPAPLNDMAWLLATDPDLQDRDPEQALRLAERAAALTGHENARILDTLGAACAAAGQFDRAVATARKALELADARGDATADPIRARLALYKQAKSYREHAAEGMTPSPP